MRYRLILIMILFFSLPAFPQSNDFGIWTSAEVEKSIGKKWSVNGEAELRTRDDSREIARWGFKLGGEYIVFKPLKLGIAYQYLHFHDIKYQDYQSRNRFIAYLQGRQKWGRFTFTLRERFQVTTKDDSDRIKIRKGESYKMDKYAINPEWSWRNRLKVSYDIRKSKFTPACSVETFFQLNNPDGNQFDGLRYIVSLTYKLKKRNSFELSGIHDREINVSNPERRNVIGIGYAYSF